MSCFLTNENADPELRLRLKVHAMSLRNFMTAPVSSLAELLLQMHGRSRRKVVTVVEIAYGPGRAWETSIIVYLIPRNAVFAREEDIGSERFSNAMTCRSISRMQ